MITWLIFGILLGMIIYVLIRNHMVFDFRIKILLEESFSNLQQIAQSKSYRHRRFDSMPSYYKMVLEFWKPLRRYYKPLENYYKD